jgi:hypothetical protein
MTPRNVSGPALPSQQLSQAAYGRQEATTPWVQSLDSPTAGSPLCLGQSEFRIQRKDGGETCHEAAVPQVVWK